MNTLPHAILRYITQRFAEGHIQMLETKMDPSGHTLYRIGLRWEDTLQQLEFDSRGKLLRHGEHCLFHGAKRHKNQSLDTL